MDKAPANDVLNGGRGIVADTFTSPLVPFYQDIERVIRKYPYDPRRSQQLMEEAGYVKGPDGFFVGKDGAPIEVDMWISSGAKNERHLAVLSDNLRASGFNIRSNVLSAAYHRDAEARAKAPGLSIRGGGASLRSLENFSSKQVAAAENRWSGRNYGGWVNPAFDRAFTAFDQTPKPSERIRQVAEMNRLITEELPTIPHWWEPNITAHVSAVMGPGLTPARNPDGSGELTRIHEWEWRS
jgi:peptide/nickel transport system substrate-binding protein